MVEKKAKFSREYGVFLELLKAEREAAGMTQNELAAKLKVTQTFISKSERGERRLDPIETRRLCMAVGSDFSAFAAKLDAALGRSASARKQPRK